MKKLYSIIFILLSVLNIHAQNSKLSPYVRQAMMSVKTDMSQSKAKGVYGRSPVHVPMITAFVRTDDTDALRQQGCRIYAQWDDICIATIPLDRLGTLASMPQIKRIEAGRSCSVTNDTTATITRARDVWQKTLPAALNQIPSSIRGNGVVVGVMDIGFDLTHPTFYSSDGQIYRIKQFWDQLDQTEGGEPVIGQTEEGNDTIYVGRQYIGQDALLALQHSYDGLTQTHGTHTTGSAAGSGWDGTSTKYSGMAPDADLCLVCNAAGDNAELIPESELYKYTTATDMLGFKYIFDYADKVGKPCVISFSEGAYDDLWESGIYSEVLSKMLGPGHILCASAGNEGGSKGTYIHKAVGESGKGAFLIKSGEHSAVYVLKSTKPVKMRLTFYKNGVNVKDKYYDLTELAQYPDSVMNDSVFIGKDTLFVDLETYPSCYDESLYATDFLLTDKNNANVGYTIPVSMTLFDEDNDIEAYCGGGYFASNTLNSSLADFDGTHNILFPGSSKDVVCVGNCGYRTSFYDYAGNQKTVSSTKDGALAPHSSIGPAISGIMKPEVVAPGMNILSGYNSFFREAMPQYDLQYDVSHFTWNDRQYQWHAMSGTSMSTPVTAGIIALWLQVCPTLTPDQVKDVIAHTAIHHDESLTYPNNSYGWGQIDAMAGVEYIQNTYTGIQEINGSRSKVYGSTAIYTLDGRQIKSLEGQHGIFITAGKKIVK